LIIFVFFSYTLAEITFPQRLEGLVPGYYWAAGIITTLVIFVSVLTHEVSHSLVAIKEGISIRKITLFVFGGVAQMEEEPRSSNSELKITIAGPLASFVLALIFGSIFFYMYFTVGDNLLTIAFLFLAQINLVMAIFNLLPAFPLDGGRLLRSTIWHFTRNLLKSTKIAVSVGSVIAFLVMAFGFFAILGMGQITGLWFVFLGWILHHAGQASYSQLLFQQAFSGVKIREIMTTDVHTVPPDLNIQDLVEKFHRYKLGAFPVVYGSTLHGLVTLNQIKDIPREKWSYKTVAYIMTPLEECITVSPHEEAASIMTKMAVEHAGRVLVIENGELVGILTRTDMMRLLQMHMILGTE